MGVKVSDARTFRKALSVVIFQTKKNYYQKPPIKTSMAIKKSQSFNKLNARMLNTYETLLLPYGPVLSHRNEEQSETLYLEGK